MTQSTVQRTAGTLADERELVERAKSGDQSVFRAIMEQNNRRLYRVARAVMKDDTEAEDVVQETYLRAFSNLSKFHGESSLTDLADADRFERSARAKTQATSNGDIGRHRKGSGNERTDYSIPRRCSRETDPERSAAHMDTETFGKCNGCLFRSPSLVFVMRDVEEFSIEETASYLGIRPETVKTDCTGHDDCCGSRWTVSWRRL